MSLYRYEDNGAFVIENFDEAPAFMNFLPGLAGEFGIPMWLYYANRGQGVCSFGVDHKDNAIMEFSPANTAMKRVASEGFRTFIQTPSGEFEPFSPSSHARRTMRVYPNSFHIEEEGAELVFTVRYFTLPYENFSALARCCELRNVTGKPLECSVLDGMPQLIPFGVTTGEYKALSNLRKSWAHVTGLETGVPFFHTRSIPGDEAEVAEAEGGYFYLSFSDGGAITPIIDPEPYFDIAFTKPVSYPPSASSEQTFTNRYACAFTPLSKTILVGSALQWTTLIGFSHDHDVLWKRAPELCDKDWVERKYHEALDLTDKLTDAVATRTADPMFDGYIRQCYLDNVLRGGQPRVLGDKVLHLFSRKHGDPERDYNFFSISAEYFSQGNGNFRDVCQNRRSDAFFCPKAAEENIRLFFSLVQADGFNPLEVRSATFFPLACADLSKFDKYPPLKKLAEKPFTAGAAIAVLVKECGLAHEAALDALEELLPLCEQRINAAFGEGYWIDHWTYLLDLVENALLVFPERKRDMLLAEGYRFFQSPVRILTRREAYVPKGNTLRQYRSLAHIDGRSHTGWLKNKDGSFAETTLLGKMAVLSLVKFASLDPFGRGLEMDGGKPGWNDAMNGLPGLFGSGVGEAYELKRLIEFLLGVDLPVTIPEEAAKLFDELVKLQNISEPFTYWNAAATAKEDYRASVNDTVSGAVRTLSAGEWRKALAAFKARLDKGLAEVEAMGDLVPTYLVHEPLGLDETGFPTGFSCRPLPSFLEGPVRQMKVVPDKAAQIEKHIRNSELLDKTLGMYKTSVPIEHESYDIGRVRAFTAGWLERESVFLHMSLKYLLEQLRTGLYDEFYRDIKTGLPPFMDPAVYGRNPLENSSFIATDVNPDPSVVGRGYVARLSGSTAEMLSIWLSMFLGDKGFTVGDGKLRLTFDPALPGWLFPEDGEAWFTLFRSVKVIYRNPSRKNTYGGGVKPRRAEVRLRDGRTLAFDGGYIEGEAAEAVRDGNAESVTITLE